MKILHTSDLHLGISLLGIPLISYQRELCESLLKISENADAAVISGDIFDTSVSSAEAIKCWSSLAESLCLERKIPVIVCAGNHDGAARLSSCGNLLRSAGLFVAGSFEDAFTPFVCGNTAFYAIPYFNPADAALYLDCPPDTASVMESACKKILAGADKNMCNILVAHCFAAGGKSAESDVSARAAESVGGAYCIPLSAFEGFDYVALGHLHKPQTLTPADSKADSKTIVRYSGTPLPYSFSEAEHTKTVTIFDTETRAVTEEEIPQPYRLRTIEDTYENIVANAETDANRGDFLRITLTDRYAGDGAYMKLKELYPNLLRFGGKHHEVSETGGITAKEAAELDIIALAKRYSEEHRGAEPDKDELEWLSAAMKEIDKEDGI